MVDPPLDYCPSVNVRHSQTNTEEIWGHGLWLPGARCCCECCSAGSAVGFKTILFRYPEHSYYSLCRSCLLLSCSVAFLRGREETNLFSKLYSNGVRDVAGTRFIESEPDLVLRKQHLARYEFASTLVRNKRVLDVACGSGYGTAILAESGAASTIGMDISDECVKYAKEHHGAGGIIFITGNGEDLSSLEPVDSCPSKQSSICTILRSFSMNCVEYSGTMVFS